MRSVRVVPESSLPHSYDGDSQEEEEGAQHRAGQAAVPHMAGVAQACIIE
jgi:hypothetical protein